MQSIINNFSECKLFGLQSLIQIHGNKTEIKMVFSLTLFRSAFMLLTCSLLLDCVQGLDIESAKESPCFEISKTVEMELDWVASAKTLYYPIMSRLDLYLNGVDFSEKSAEELQEDELYYESCVEIKLDGGKFLITSFGGKRHVFETKPIKGMEVYEFTTPSGDKGISYTTLTDNKTFVFNAICWSKDNQMSWGVTSSTKSLPKETVKLIHDHAASLGFKREQFTGLRINHCKGQDAEVKTEL